MLNYVHFSAKTEKFQDVQIIYIELNGYLANSNDISIAFEETSWKNHGKFAFQIL